MKFKGRNGGLAIGMHNHIRMFCAFVISLLVFLIPTVVLICIHNPYFWVFLLMPAGFLLISFGVFLFVKYDENVFLSGLKKDHIFEIKNDCLFKDGKQIKLIRSVKIYRYNSFLYMETSHSMFIIKNTDFILGDSKSFLEWAKAHNIRIKRGY